MLRITYITSHLPNSPHLAHRDALDPILDCFPSEYLQLTALDMIGQIFSGDEAETLARLKALATDLEDVQWSQRGNTYSLLGPDNSEISFTAGPDRGMCTIMFTFHTPRRGDFFFIMSALLILIHFRQSGAEEKFREVFDRAKKEGHF